MPVYGQDNDRGAAANSSPESLQKPIFNPDEDYNASDVDSVTLAILSDALLSLQFFAVAALENDEDIGLAQSGVVRAYLARAQKEDAIRIANRIPHPVWRARSYIWISDYLLNVEKDKTGSREWIDRAIAEVLNLSEQSDDGDTLEIASIRLAEVGEFEAATKIAQAIPAIAHKVSILQKVASLALAADRSSDMKREAAKVLLAAVEEAKNLTIPIFEKAAILMDLGAAQLLAEDTENALATFQMTQVLILEGPARGRLRSLTRLAAKMVESGNQRDGMIVVRMTPQGIDRARALGAVAAIIGRQNINAAIPLFHLAMEEAIAIDDPSKRFEAIDFLVARQAEVGRLKSAFEFAFQITEDEPRAKALLEMGRILIESRKFDGAEILKDYIPYTSMRAQILGAVILGREQKEDPEEEDPKKEDPEKEDPEKEDPEKEDPEKEDPEKEYLEKKARENASALLAEALDPTGFPILPAYTADGLSAVLKAQVKAGLESADPAIFSRAKNLVQALPNGLARVAPLAQIAIAETRRGRLEEAQTTISAAYRNAFEHRDDAGFEQALMQISLAQISAGDLIGAYDTAARISEPPPEGPFPRTPDGGFEVPRYKALIRVAAAAGRLGDPRFGQEVIGKIEHPPAKAAGLAAVAIAMSNQTTDLIDVVNDIRDGALLSPNYRYLDHTDTAETPEMNPDDMLKKPSASE